MLNPAPKKGFTRQAYTQKNQIIPTENEKAAHKVIQAHFAKESMLTHFNPKRWFYIDLDRSGRGFGVVAYHVAGENPEDIKKEDIQLILFLSKLLSSAENHYWPTELEVACLV